MSQPLPEWLVTSAPQQTDEVTLNAQFLLAEDLALKNLLRNSVTVTDGNNKARQMGAYFSMPDPELQKQAYPYATIDLLDVSENRAQVQSTYGPISTDDNSAYLLNGLDITDATYGVSTLYGLSPMLLTYQVSTWARLPRHDRAIISALSYGALHPRFGQINVNDNLRRLIVLGFTKRDTTTDNKRLFHNIWTIQIPSEVFYDEVTLTKRAASVSINSGTLATPPSTMGTPVLYPGRS